MQSAGDEIGRSAVDVSATLGEAIARFERAWLEGERPAIDEHLPPDGSLRHELLIELAHIDLELRLKACEEARVEEYLTRYPALADDADVVRDLLAAEYAFRKRREPDLSIAEHQARFPQHALVMEDWLRTAREPRNRRGTMRINCPHCNSAIALAGNDVTEQLSCPSCGSQFRLDANRTVSWRQEKLPRVGKFQLLAAVGRGAFGTVYRAHDVELDRIVAVKLPRSGRLATQADEERFVKEARMAAQLHHPGIVPVYEVGRTEAYPYIVAEYVDGVTLADALTGERFSFREAVELAVQVADALDHAHRQGVVHRDLKPSNIMLERDDGTSASGSGRGSRRDRESRDAAPDSHTARPQAGGSTVGSRPGSASGVSTPPREGPRFRPRIMDFGLARRDEGEVTVTLEGQVLGTPAYMSPEQARGESHQADGRTDVYSLGVILYELLVGERPFRGNVRMLEHQVLHDEAPSPRRFNDRLPRDLDTVVLRCLQKDPGRRYESAADLAADLRRWLRGEPILARPVSRAERAWRWCRRNPALAGTLVALAVVVPTSLAVVTGLYLNAERQRQLAEHREAATRAVSKFYEDNVLAAARPGGWEGGVGKDVTLLTALDAASLKIDESFAGQPDLEAAVRDTLGMTYWYLGAFDAANPHLEKALEIRLKVLSPDDVDTLTSIHNLAMQRWKQGNLRDAVGLARQAWEGRRRVLGSEHKDTLFTQLNVGLFLEENGDYDQAETVLRQAIEACKRTLGPDHHHTLYGQHDLSNVLWWKGKRQESLALELETLEARRRSLGPDHPDTLRSMGNRAASLTALGQLDEAEALYRHSLEGRRRVLGNEHVETLWAEFGLAAVLRERGDYVEAEQLLRHCLETNQRVMGAEHRETLETEWALATLIGLQGNFAEQEKLYRHILETERRVLGPEDPETLLTQSALATFLCNQAKTEEGEALHRLTLEARRRVLGPEHVDTLVSLSWVARLIEEDGYVEEAERIYRELLATQRKLLNPDDDGLDVPTIMLGSLLSDNGHLAEAEPLLREGLANREKNKSPSSWQIAAARSILGACLARQQKFAEAEPLVVGSYEALSKKAGAPAKEVAQALDRVIELYETWAKPDEAEAWRQKRPVADSAADASIQ